MFILLTTPGFINFIIRCIKKGLSISEVENMFKEHGYEIKRIEALYNHELVGETECAYIENLIARVISYAPILSLYGLALNASNDKRVGFEKYEDFESYSKYDLDILEKRKIIKKMVLRKEDKNE